MFGGENTPCYSNQFIIYAHLFIFKTNQYPLLYLGTDEQIL